MRPLQKYTIIAVAAICYAVPSAVAAAVTYKVTDLGALGDAWSFGFGINSQGQVTGRSYTGPLIGGGRHAFKWDGTMHDIGTLGGTYSAGLAINDRGHVTGWSDIQPNGPEHAFLYDGVMHDLGTLGGSSSIGNAINSTGQVAGTSGTSGSGGRHAFLYDGSMHDLGTLGGSYSEGNAINDSGWVTGQSNTAAGESHAFLYDGDMHDLGTLGGTHSGGIDVNANGHVTGFSYTSDNVFRHAFFYDSTMHDLGTLPEDNSSIGRGVNLSAQVVGESLKVGIGDPTVRPFLYTAGQGMVDLNSLIPPDSGWTLIGALAINDAGQITGYGSKGDQNHAFLLIPIPEPSTWLHLVLGAAIVLFGRRRAS